MKTVEVFGIGETVEEAKKDAMSKFEKDYENVKFEVLQQPEKKKFGIFGGSEARVKAFAEIPDGKKAKEFLEEIVDKFDIKDLKITTQETADGVTFDIDGENLGSLIGYRGETLAALQYLTGLVANKSNNSFYRVTINVGEYRKRREQTVERLAKKAAYRALKIRRNVPMEHMNAYERKVAHTTVQAIDGVTSWSEGENRFRHVVIGLDPDYKGKKEEKTSFDDNESFSLYEKI